MNIKKIFKKYNYDISKIIGFENSNENKLEKYYLNVNSKVIRRYHDNLKNPLPLICTYIDMEQVLTLRIKLTKNTLKKITNLDNFIKTKIYSELEDSETIQYIYKYKIIEYPPTNSNVEEVAIDVIFIPKDNFYAYFKKYIDLIGYIDYISFPAFSYETLYNQNILEKMRDLFIIFLWDKTYITIYENGHYVYNGIINFGLKNLFNTLKNNFEIENFDRKVFEILLNKKGLVLDKYYDEEKEIYYELKREIIKFFDLLKEELSLLLKEHEVENLDRIFLTTNKGNILGIDKFIEPFFSVKGRTFDFYEKYNLDNLPISPFLFLSMLETYQAFKYNNFQNNFSLWKRPKNFFYRPTGKLVLSFTTSFFLFSTIYIGSNIYYSILDKKRLSLENKLNNLQKKAVMLDLNIKNLKDKKEKLLNKFNNEIKKDNKLIKMINNIYELKSNKKNYLFFKFYNLTKELFKNKVFIKDLVYDNNKLKLTIVSDKEINIANFFNFLKKENWNFENKFITIKKDNKSNFYIANIIIDKDTK